MKIAPNRAISAALVVLIGAVALASCTASNDPDEAGSSQGPAEQSQGPSAKVQADLEAYLALADAYAAANNGNTPSRIEHLAADGATVPAKSADDATYMACAGGLGELGQAFVLYVEDGDGNVYFTSSLLDDQNAVHRSGSSFPVPAAPGSCALQPETGVPSDPPLTVVSDGFDAGDAVTW